MVFKRFLFFGLLLIVFVLTSCKKELPIEIPDVGISKHEVNTRIRVSIWGETRHSFRNKDGIDLSVEVITVDQVAFSRDYGVRLFVYENDQWYEIENNMDYSEKIREPIILPFSEDSPSKAGVAGVSPYYPNLNKEVPLRVILIGNIVHDGKITEEKTAGYIDVILKP